MSEFTLEPVDYCGCGDMGYLTKKTIQVPLKQGTGKLLRVPVYTCKDQECKEYTVPSSVARRIDEIAEFMEDHNLLTKEYSGENITASSQESADLTSSRIQFEALTIKMNNQEFEDAKVILVIPGEALFLQHRLDSTEYYVLQPVQSDETKQLMFSLGKFYYEENSFQYDDFIGLQQESLIKELGTFSLEEFEDILLDEFGAIIK